MLPNHTHLDVDVAFTDDNGDVDLRVYNETGTRVAHSVSITDNEYIDIDLDPGTYYLKVYPFSGPGNTYDLRWDSVPQEDAYERYRSNDTSENAYWLSSYENTWLSDFAGLAISNDPDVYKIDLDSDQLRLIVDAQFSHTQGDIDIGVYDDDGHRVDSSASTTDNEFIDVEVSNPGPYYLYVDTYSNSTLGNSYDLLWLDHNPYGTSGADTLDGTAYQDTLYGYDGNDILSGQQDQDELYGGHGTDSLYGGRGRDLLQGGHGNDRLYGQGGHDKLCGDHGNDRLFGGGGNDTLIGVAVNEIPPGENDIDRLKGNGGADLFVLGDATQVYYEGSGSARILDFNLNQKDQIQLYSRPGLYQLSESFGHTRIELNNGDLLGLVKGVTSLDLNDSYFSFV